MFRSGTLLFMGLPRIQPIAPTRIQAPFNDPEFIFELKHDGFRAVAYIEDGTCRLISRKQIQYKSFAVLAAAMVDLPVKNAILDGELVCLDQDGRSQFLQLMRRKSRMSLSMPSICFGSTAKTYVGSRSWKERTGCGS
jgi:ATP-dependent DNA ligase